MGVDVELCCFDCKEYVELGLTRQQPFDIYDLQTAVTVSITNTKYCIVDTKQLEASCSEENGTQIILKFLRKHGSKSEGTHRLIFGMDGSEPYYIPEEEYLWKRAFSVYSSTKIGPRIWVEELKHTSWEEVMKYTIIAPEIEWQGRRAFEYLLSNPIHKKKKSRTLYNLCIATLVKALSTDQQNKNQKCSIFDERISQDIVTEIIRRHTAVTETRRKNKQKLPDVMQYFTNLYLPALTSIDFKNPIRGMSFDIAPLSSCCPNLQKVILEDFFLERAVTVFGPSLTSLSIEVCYGIKQKEDIVVTCTNLQSLSIFRSRFAGDFGTSAQISRILSQMPHLRRLELTGVKPTSAVAKDYEIMFGSCPNLEYLSFAADADFDYTPLFHSLPKLTTFLSYTPSTSSISFSSSLTSLSLCVTFPKFDLCTLPAAFPNLEIFFLRARDTKPNLGESWQKWKSLRELTCPAHQLFPEIFEPPSDIYFPNLVYLGIQHSKFSPMTLQYISAHCPALATLNLVGCIPKLESDDLLEDDVNPLFLTQLQTTNCRFPHVRKLVLSRAEFSGSVVAEIMSRMPDLQVVVWTFRYEYKEGEVESIQEKFPQVEIQTK